METWNDVAKIIGTIVGALGGISVISIAVIKYSSNIIADRLSKKYSLDLDKKLETHKSILENKNYKSKVRFDKEFEVYTELSEKSLDAVSATSNMIHFLNSNMLTTDFKEKKSEIVNKYNLANSINQKYSAFMQEHIYDEYFQLFMLFRRLLNYFTYYERTKKKLEIEGGTDNFIITILPPYTSEYYKDKAYVNEEYTLTTLREKIILLQKDVSEKSNSISKNLRKEMQTWEVS